MYFHVGANVQLIIGIKKSPPGKVRICPKRGSDAHILAQYCYDKGKAFFTTKQVAQMGLDPTLSCI